MCVCVYMCVLVFDTGDHESCVVCMYIDNVCMYIDNVCMYIDNVVVCMYIDNDY